MIKKAHIVTVAEYMLMICTVLYSSVWALFTGAQSNTFSRIVIALLGFLLVLEIKSIGFADLKKSALVAGAILIFLFVTRYNFMRVVLYLLIPFCLFTIYFSVLQKKGEEDRLFLCLSNIITVISAVSLFLYTFGTLLNLLPFSSEVRVWWGEEEKIFKTYYHLLYEAQDVTFFGLNIMRNCSIFPEAPGFAAYLALALGGELFLRKKLKFVNISILIAACITSFSAKAILLAAAAIALRFLIVRSKKPIVVILKCLLVVAAAVLAVFVILDKMNEHSFYIRLDDFNAALKTFTANPLFGAGYYNDAAIITHFEYAYRANNGLSMGIAVLLAQGGLWLFGLYVIPAINKVFCSQSGKRLSLGFVLIFFGMLFITNIPFGMITICAISYFGAGEKTLLTKIKEGVKMWRNKA